MLAGCNEAQSRGAARDRSAGNEAAGTQADAGGMQAAADKPGASQVGLAASGGAPTGGAAGSATNAAGKGQETASSAAGAAVRDISFDDVKFEMEPGQPFQRSMLGPKIEQLSGSRIRVRGYIHPQSVFTLTDITAFVLVRDNQQCCFGPGAMLYDSMMVYMAEGRTTNFTDRPITVEGVFRIEELVGPDGKHYSIYRVDAVSAG